MLGLVVFNRLFIINIILLLEIFMFFVVKVWMVCLCWFDNMVINIIIFNDNNFRDNVFVGYKVFKCLIIVFIFYIFLYFGRVGFVVNVFLRKWEISGWLLKDWLFCDIMILVIVFLVVFNVL